MRVKKNGIVDFGPTTAFGVIQLNLGLRVAIHNKGLFSVINSSTCQDKLFFRYFPA
jgi:hypothetical protein